MKIGLIAVNYYPDLAGGAEFYTYHMMNRLADMGHEIHVFTQLTAKGNRPEHDEGKVRVHRVKTHGTQYRLKIWPGLRKKLEQYGLDRLIILDYAQPFTRKGLRYAKNRRIPAFIMINDIQSLKTGRHPIKHYFLREYDRHMAGKVLSRADGILVRTAWTRDHLLKTCNLRPGACHVTPSGLTSEEFTPGDPSKFPLQGKIILFLGRIRKQKGVFDLLKAFKKVKKQVPDAKLVYAGPDDKEYDGLEFTPQLKQMVKEQGIADVHFIGPVYGREKNNALAACAVMALPSSFENFGQAYCQALAQGRPAIGTYGGGIPEIIDENIDGYLVNTGDTEKLAEYLVHLLKNPEKAVQMGEKGREKVKKYSYAALARELESVLRTQE